jgi:predicted RNase H-like nuclease
VGIEFRGCVLKKGLKVNLHAASHEFDVFICCLMFASAWKRQGNFVYPLGCRELVSHF